METSALSFIQKFPLFQIPKCPLLMRGVSVIRSYTDHE